MYKKPLTINADGFSCYIIKRSWFYDPTPKKPKTISFQRDFRREINVLIPEIKRNKAVGSEPVGRQGSMTSASTPDRGYWNKPWKQFSPSISSWKVTKERFVEPELKRMDIRRSLFAPAYSYMVYAKWRWKQLFMQTSTKGLRRSRWGTMISQTW